jgi:hypothetical protein
VGVKARGVVLCKGLKLVNAVSTVFDQPTVC